MREGAPLLPLHWPSLPWQGKCFTLLDAYIELCFVCVCEVAQKNFW